MALTVSLLFGSSLKDAESYISHNATRKYPNCKIGCNVAAFVHNMYMCRAVSNYYFEN